MAQKSSLRCNAVSIAWKRLGAPSKIDEYYLIGDVEVALQLKI